MRRFRTRMTALCLAFLLAAGSMGAGARAVKTDDSFVTEGTYSFTSDGGGNLQVPARAVKVMNMVKKGPYNGKAVVYVRRGASDAKLVAEADGVRSASFDIAHKSETEESK